MVSEVATEVIVGTAGHIDHGKTALVKALTGTDADRLPEEKRRGITVDIGFAEMSIGVRHFGFVDVPGHERFVKNMLAGASGIDLVLLVIAADDGVMPQTREHFDICRLLGVRSGVVAVTKSDLVDDDTLELAKLDAADLVAGSFLETAPIIPVSSVTGEGIDALREALCAAVVERKEDGLVARLPIDRSFSMKGFGTVVTGTLASGSIKEGDEIELLPSQRRLRVRGLQSHGKSCTQVNAGQRAAVNLAGIDHIDVTRGMLLAEPGVLRPTHMFDAQVEVLAGAKRALRSRQQIRLHVGTAEVLARVRVLDTTGEIAPGANGFVQLSLESPVAAVPGERFILRSYSPQATIAGGEVLDNSPSRHRLRDVAHVVRRLALRTEMPKPRERVTALIEAAGKRGMTLDDLRAATAYNKAVIKAAVTELTGAELIVRAGDSLIAKGAFDELCLAATAALESFHKRSPLERGMSREALRETAFANVSDAVFQAAASHLTAHGAVNADGDLLHLPAFSTSLSEEEKKVSDAILSAIVAAGLEVPKINEVVTDAAGSANIPDQKLRRLVRLHVDGGDLIKVTDDLYFGSETIDELTVRLRKYADSTPERAIDVARFKDLAGVSRKYAIPLLEYFDREKITVRRGDKRVVL
jgi:selenocysteine-specific elongation factor